MSYVKGCRAPGGRALKLVPRETPSSTIVRTSTEKAVDRRPIRLHTTEEPVERPMNEIYFPPRELEVMSILWRLGSGTVADVRDALDETLAYTSVLSALQT